MKHIRLTAILTISLFGALLMPTAHADDVKLVPTKPTRLSKDELAVWNDASFRRRFAESYIAETDIEPRVTESEREAMLEILELISSDDMDGAEALLRDYLGMQDQPAREKRPGFFAKKTTKRGGGDAASAVFDFTLGNIYFQQERLDDAAATYQNAVGKYEKFRRAWKNLGLIYVRKGDFEKALPALTRVVELGGGDALTYGLLGFAYSSTDQHLSAEAAYRMANLLDPKTTDWKTGLARSFFRQERYAEAAALCKQLIADTPDNTSLWLLQANAWIGLDQPLKAAENYQIVDRLGGSTPESLNMLGDIYVNEELYSLAADSYIRAMKKKPDASVDRAIRSAKILVTRGAFDDTRRILAQVQNVAARDMSASQRKDILKMRARLAVADGSGEEEVKVLKEIVELDPLDGEALILLGQHSDRAGKTDRAIYYYERAAKIEKFEADAKVRHAQLLVANGKYNEALPLLRRAQTVNPRDNVQQYLEQVERVARNR